MRLQCQLFVCACIFGYAAARRVASSERFSGTLLGASETDCGGRYPAGGTAESFDAQSGFEQKCGACLMKSGCKWCPLTLSCVPAGKESCPRRAGRKNQALDMKIKRAKDCRGRNPPWVDMMEASYGKQWAEEKHKYLDSVRCVQWAMGWSITPDETMKGSEYARVGMWACMSALLRDGFLAAIGGANNLTVVASDTSKELYKNSTTWRPRLCDLLDLHFGDGTICYIRGMLIDQFKEFSKIGGPYWGKLERTKDSLRNGPLQLLDEPVDPNNWHDFQLATTFDNRYKVDLGLRNDSYLGEPENIMRLLNGDNASGTESLAQHFKKFPASYINRDYAMLKVRLGPSRNYVTLSDDPFFNMDVVAKQEHDYMEIDQTPRADGSGVHFTRYKLAATKLNGTKFALTKKEFDEKEDGMLHLRDQQCLSLRQIMSADIEFLQSHLLTHYSIAMLSVARNAKNSEIMCDKTPGKPYCLETPTHLYTFSVVDYTENTRDTYNNLQKFGGIIFGDKPKYAQRMRNLVESMCPTEESRQFKEKLQAWLVEVGGSVETAFKSIDTNGDGTISPVEMKNYLEHLENLHLSKSEFYKVFAELDEDHVDFAGFQEMMKVVLGPRALLEAQRQGQQLHEPGPGDAQSEHEDGLEDDPENSARMRANAPALLLSLFALFVLPW